MAEFKMRKDYYCLMIDTEYELHNESDFYYLYLDAKRYGHYFTITVMDWQILDFYNRLHEYIEVHRKNNTPQVVRTPYRLINEIVSLIGDPREPTHASEETHADDHE